MECAVRAGGAESAVDGVEGDGVYGVYVALVAGPGGGLPMAFEAEVGGGVFFLDVLDGAAAFYGADGEAGRIGEAGYDSRLPFEWGLHCFVEFGGFIEGDDVDVAVGGADDEHFVFAVNAVNALLTWDCGDRVGGSEVPVFDCFVPTAGYEDLACLAGDIDHADGADGLVMYCYLLGCTTGTKVEKASCFIGAAANYLSAVLLKVLVGVWTVVLRK